MNIDVKNFGARLRSVLQVSFEDDLDMLNTWFNIILVKFEARPSTLIDYYKTSDILAANNEFRNFIKNDPDLEMDWFKTEKIAHKDLVIYNNKFSDLFIEKDISDTGNENIHLMRGIRLGFPYVTDKFQSFSLLHMDMFISPDGTVWVPVYGYMCPDTREDIDEGVNQWYQFRQYASYLGFSLSVHITPNRFN